MVKGHGNPNCHGNTGSNGTKVMVILEAPVHRMPHQKWKYSRLIELFDLVRDYRADGVDGPQEMELK